MTSRTALLAALFLSLALNVFIAGAFVGSRLNRPPPPAVAGQDPLRARNPVAVALKTLPPEAQARWRDEMPEFVRDYGPKVRQSRQLRRRTIQGFGAEPFDAQAALSELNRARALELESRAEMDRRLVAFAAGLPQPEREAFGEALARPAAVRRAPGSGQP